MQVPVDDCGAEKYHRNAFDGAGGSRESMMPAYRRSHKGSAVLTFLPFVDRDSVQVGLGPEGRKAVDAECCRRFRPLPGCFVLCNLA